MDEYQSPRGFVTAHLVASARARPAPGEHSFDQFLDDINDPATHWDDET